MRKFFDKVNEFGLKYPTILTVTILTLMFSVLYGFAFLANYIDVLMSNR